MKDRLHIAFFTNTYLPTTSGVVRSIQTFRNQLCAMGHNVFIFAQHARYFEDQEPFIFRYPAIEIPFANDYAVPIPVSSTVNEVLPILMPDIIHSHHPFLLGETAATKARELGCPLVFTFHTRYEEYSHYVPIDQSVTRRVIISYIARYLERCHHIVVPSESIRDLLREYGVEGPVTAVPTGIDLAPFQAMDRAQLRHDLGWDDDLVLISVGRLAKEKNFEMLIDAAAQVIHGRSNVRLVIVGGGMEQQALEDHAAERGIADRVQFTGRVPYEEIPSLLTAADLFCFASVTETQGLVTMEAMAANLPVVAVAATGTSDTVEHGQDGLLTPNDSRALANAIQRVLDDPQLRKTLQTGAQQKVQWFDIKLQAARLLEVYEQAMTDSAAGRHIRVPA